MENEPLLDNLRFKIKTDSLLLNYKYNSIDSSSLDDYLTFPFKNIPIVGDIIHFEEFYSDTSDDNLVEEFLIDYHLPKEITTSIITDYADLKKLLVEDVIEIDSLGSNILDSADVDLVTDILMFSYMYGNSVQDIHNV